MSVFSNIYRNAYDKIENDTKMNNLDNTFALYEIYENMLINSFVWKGLPIQANGKPIYYSRPEQYMFYRGLMAAFVENGVGYILPAFPAGKLREDGFYTEYIMYAFNGDNYRKKFEDIELCENLPNQLPTRPLVMYYLERMKNVLSTIDVQIIKSRGGDIFEVEDEKQKKQVAELWENMKNNIPIQTIINDSYSKKQIQKLTVYDSRESQILDMWSIYDKFKHEFLTYFGINNVETEKKERLITDEANANNDLIQHTVYETMYISRLDFCERCHTHEGWEDIFGDILVLKNREEVKDENEKLIEEAIAPDVEELEEINEELDEKEQEQEQVDEEQTEEKEGTDDAKDE